MKKLHFIILVVAGIALLTLLYFFVGARKATAPETTNNQMPTASPSITPAVQGKSEPLEQTIAKLLAQKNNWELSIVEVHVATSDGQFAKGDVKFKGEMGGGLWFAANVAGVWKIVYDGNGMITCDQLTNYQNFPKTLIPECYDKTTQKMVTR